MFTKNVVAVCIAKSLKDSNYHKHNPEFVPTWNLKKMVEQSWKMGEVAYELEIIEAWAYGQYYGSFQIHNVMEMENNRKSFSVSYISGSKSHVGDTFRFKGGPLQYFSKKVS
jgi:hypothetical protein